MGFPIAKVSGSITAAAQTFVLPVNQASMAIVQMTTGALAGHNCAIEASMDSTTGADGTWFTISAIRSNAPGTIEQATGVLAATPAYMWLIPVIGFKYIRFRATAHTSGTANYYAMALDDGFDGFLGSVISGAITISSGAVTNTPATPTQDYYTSLATTNARSVKSSAGQVYGVVATNLSASVRYLKLYNKASAPTVGTDVPVMTIPIAAGAIVSLEIGAQGMRFNPGIACAITGGAADTDATVVAAGDVKTAIAYI